MNYFNLMNKNTPLAGIEPAAFELEVQRAIHCATGASIFSIFTFECIQMQVLNTYICI